MEKKGIAKEKGSLSFLLGPWTRRGDPMRALLLHLVLCVSLAGVSQAENWGWGLWTQPDAS